MLLAMAMASKREGTWKLADGYQNGGFENVSHIIVLSKAAAESSHADRYKMEPL